MKITNLTTTPKNQVNMEGAGGVFKQLPIGKSDGSPHFSFRVFTLEPGGYTPYHTHQAEHVNYIIAGEGALVDEQGTEHPLKAGDFSLVLPMEKHQYRNTSSAGDFVMICAVPVEYE